MDRRDTGGAAALEEEVPAARSDLRWGGQLCQQSRQVLTSGGEHGISPLGGGICTH